MKAERPSFKIVKNVILYKYKFWFLIAACHIFMSVANHDYIVVYRICVTLFYDSI